MALLVSFSSSLFSFVKRFSLCLFSLLGFTSPVLAAGEYSFTELNAVFITGLSLPLFLMLMTSSQLNRSFKGVLLVVSSIFSLFIYQWLTAELSNILLVVTSSANFIFLLVSCYFLAKIKKAEQLTQSQAKNQVGDEAQMVSSSLALDPVTNLPTYQQGLNKLISAMKVRLEDRYIAVVFKPINFHELNKVLGHQNSDILLLQLAYNIQQCASVNRALLNFNQGESPLNVARLQGLDFLVVLDVSSSKHSVEILVENLCRELSNSVPKAMSFKSFSLNFELAFGAAILGEHGNTAEQLIAHASDALLDATREQKYLCYFDQQAVIYTEKQLSKMEKLKQAVVQEELNWLVNPQLSLTNRKLIGFQVTVDWPELNKDNPTNLAREIYQLAEYSGEIHRLTKQYITQAITILGQSHQENFKTDVAINLSSQVLFEPELIPSLLTQLDKVNVLAKYLVIEIDEDLFFSKQRQVKLAIDQLKANGFSIAINQFSGSFEALRYLRKVAINKVQLDVSLLSRAEEEHTDKAIINALVNVARKMKLPVIATGINSQIIAANFQSIGGEIGQGKSIAAAIQAKDVSAWLAAWTKQNS